MNLYNKKPTTTKTTTATTSMISSFNSTQLPYCWFCNSCRHQNSRFIDKCIQCSAPNPQPSNIQEVSISIINKQYNNNNNNDTKSKSSSSSTIPKFVNIQTCYNKNNNNNKNGIAQNAFITSSSPISDLMINQKKQKMFKQHPPQNSSTSTTIKYIETQQSKHPFISPTTRKPISTPANNNLTTKIASTKPRSTSLSVGKFERQQQPTKIQGPLLFGGGEQKLHSTTPTLQRKSLSTLNVSQRQQQQIRDEVIESVKQFIRNP